jgi:hypothetical protein
VRLNSCRQYYSRHEKADNIYLSNTNVNEHSSTESDYEERVHNFINDPHSPDLFTEESGTTTPLERGIERVGDDLDEFNSRFTTESEGAEAAEEVPEEVPEGVHADEHVNGREDEDEIMDVTDDERDEECEDDGKYE